MHLKMSIILQQYPDGDSYLGAEIATGAPAPEAALERTRKPVNLGRRIPSLHVHDLYTYVIYSASTGNVECMLPSGA